MFPFGSVLTNIPLFILAAVYLLYMGTAAFSRTRNAEGNEASSEKTAKVIMAEVPAVNAGSAYIFKFFPNPETGSAFIEEEPENHIYEIGYTPAEIRPEGVAALFTGSSIFSRPPPVA